VVDIVEPNISGEPLKDFWELIIRSAIQSGGDIVPFGIPDPVHILKLVLNIEQPDPHHAGEPHHSQMDEDKRPEANCQAHYNRDRGQHHICQQGVPDRFFPQF